MYLALVRNQCFYKIHKRKTFFFAEEPNDSFAFLSLLFGPVSFLKLLESEGESFSLSLKKSVSFFLFALCDQGVWGGKHRFSSPDGNAFSDNEQRRRRIVFGLQAPSTSPKGRVWFFGRHTALQEPGAREGRPKERAARGPRGPQPQGPASYVASCPCSQDTLAASLRGRSFL